MAARTVTTNELRAIPLPDGPPRRSRLLSEVATAVEPVRLVLRSPRLALAPRGNGRCTLLIPGWMAPELAMSPIGSYLRALGHDARGWGLGVNRGDVENLRDEVAEMATTLADETGRPINLIGWSLGGIIAREVGRVAPDSVHRIVTYGSPVLGGPSHTVGASRVGVDECSRITELQEHLDENEPITVPVTSMFTRKDAAVDWRACIDRSSLDATTIEVDSTHVGMGIDPDVWITTARALAET